MYALKQSAFGGGDGGIWLNNVDCVGDETNILQCRFETNTMTCDHTRDAGVNCAPGKRVYVLELFTITLLYKYYYV